MGLFDITPESYISIPSVDIRNLILGYYKSANRKSILIIKMNDKSIKDMDDWQKHAFKEENISIYPASKDFSFTLKSYLTTILKLKDDNNDILVFNKIDDIENSPFKDSWQRLILDLISFRPFEIIEGEKYYQFNEEGLLVFLCKEIPDFIKGNNRRYDEIEYQNTGRCKELMREGEKIIKGMKENSKTTPTETEKDKNMDTPKLHPNIDWEQRRFELVKAIIAGKLAGKGTYDLVINDTHINQIIGTANKVIEKLQNRINDFEN